MEWIHDVPQHHAVGVKQGTVEIGVGGVVGAFNHLTKVIDASFILVQRVNFEVFLKRSIIC
jgi:hypothetical protein